MSSASSSPLMTSISTPVSYSRIPLRLGEEVFDNGRISDRKKADFIKSIQAFKLITEIFDVRELRACATSAMREAENGEDIRKAILEETGVEIEVIYYQEGFRFIKIQ